MTKSLVVIDRLCFLLNLQGMRQSCDVFIELDIEKALKDGIEIFISTNKVILTRGINGALPTVCLFIGISFLSLIGIL